MADLVAPERNPWLGLPADWLEKLKQLAEASRRPEGDLLSSIIGNFPAALDRASQGFSAFKKPPSETGPDASLFDKAQPVVGDVAGMLPGGKIAALAKGLAGLKGLGFAGTFLPAGLRELDLIQKAEQLEAAGKKSPEIWREVGLSRIPKDAEKRWMYEVPDTSAQLTPTHPNAQNFAAGPYKDIVSHPELLKEAPYLGESRVATGPATERSGSYSPSTGDIGAWGPNQGEILSAILHEGQHRIQDVTGMPGGASRSQILGQLKVSARNTLSKDELDRQSYLKYRQVPGELLASTVQERMNLPQSVLKEVSPIETMREVVKKLLLDYLPPLP